MNFLRIQRDIAPIEPEVITHLWGIPLTNTFFLILLIILLLVLFAYLYVRKFTIIPNKVQNMAEVMYEGMLDLVQQITGNSGRAEKIFPLIGALFVFIGIANIIGLIPGITSFTYGGEMSLFRTPTADFNTTLGLALAMVLLIQVASIRDYGILGYIGRFVRVKELIQGFKKGIKEGFIAFIEFLIGFLDIIAECAKVISLSFRLFGNMLAGEIIAILILGAFAFVLPALWLSLNLLFAFVQAIVFGALVAAYYSLSVKEESEKSSEE